MFAVKPDVAVIDDEDVRLMPWVVLTMNVPTATGVGWLFATNPPASGPVEIGERDSIGTDQT